MVCILLSQFGLAPDYQFLLVSFVHHVSLGVCKSQCAPVWILHSEGESSNSSLAAAENPLILENGDFSLPAYRSENYWKLNVYQSSGFLFCNAFRSTTTTEKVCNTYIWVLFALIWPQQNSVIRTWNAKMRWWAGICLVFFTKILHHVP